MVPIRTTFKVLFNKIRVIKFESNLESLWVLIEFFVDFMGRFQDGYIIGGRCIRNAAKKL
jgi:hypothetical protein